MLCNSNSKNQWYTNLNELNRMQNKYDINRKFMLQSFGYVPRFNKQAYCLGQNCILKATPIKYSFAAKIEIWDNVP